MTTIASGGMAEGVERGDVRFGRALRIIAFFGFYPCAFLVTYPTFGMLVLVACCAVAIYDLVPLVGPKDALDKIEARYFFRLVLLTFAMGGLAGIAQNTEADPSIGLLLQFGGIGITLFLAYQFCWRFRPRALALEGEPVARKSLATTVVGADDLRDRRKAMTAIDASIGALPLFDPDNLRLASAWTRKDTTLLEQLLRDADALNRTSWRKGMDVYNEAVGTVDVGRSTLRALMTKSEAMLEAYKIDYSAIVPERSGELGGVVATTRMQRDLSQKLRYSGGVSHAVRGAASGAVPWQFAAVVAAGAVVMHFVNQSKELRQLKEMEGVITSNAEAARGDFTLMRSLITTRLAPQTDRILAVMDDLHTCGTALRADEQATNATARAQITANRLARAVVEARHLLELTAGN